MSDLSQTLDFFKNILPWAIILFKKIGNKTAIEDKRQSNIHAYAMQYLKVNLVACQVWSKVKLLHTLYGGYLNHVRQALYALPKIKHVVYYNAMQGTTQAHFLVKLLKSRTLSSFHNRQKSHLI